MVHGEIDPLRELHERQGVPLLGRSGASLGDFSVEVGQEIGRHPRRFHGVGEAPEEPVGIDPSERSCRHTAWWAFTD